MPRGRRLSRAQRATVRCEWRTKRPLPEYEGDSDRQLMCKIGEKHGFGPLAVGRAIFNHAKDNDESDDDHCVICLKSRGQAKQEAQAPELRASTSSQSPSRENIDRRESPLSSVAPQPSLEDVIFVQSDDDLSPINRAGPSEKRMRSTTASSSPRKRSRRDSRVVYSSDEDESEEWTPDLPSASTSRRVPKQRRSHRPAASKEPSEVVQFLRTIDPAYARHAPALSELGITTRSHLKGIQSMDVEIRAALLVRMEQRGLSAVERAMIEDAIIKLPG